MYVKYFVLYKKNLFILEATFNTASFDKCRSSYNWYLQKTVIIKSKHFKNNHKTISGHR